MPVEWPTPEAVEWPMVEWPMPVEWPEGEWATRAASEALDLPRREEAPAAALRQRAGHPGLLAAIPAMADPGVLLTATGTDTAASSVLASGSYAYAGPSCGYGDPYSDYYDYNNCYGYGPDYAAPDYGPYGW